MNKSTLKVALLMVGAAAGLATGLTRAGVLQDLGAAAYKAAGSPSYTVVIPPGARLMIGGKATVVSGGDLCPPSSTNTWVVGGQSEMGHSCIVVAPDTKAVPVDVYGPNGERTREIWAVERQERNGVPTLELKRPNGEYVAQAR